MDIGFIREEFKKRWTPVLLRKTRAQAILKVFLSTIASVLPRPIAKHLMTNHFSLRRTNNYCIFIRQLQNSSSKPLSFFFCMLPE